MRTLYETERLKIREWKLNDYNDLFEYVSNPVITKFLTFKTYEKKQEAKDRIKHIQNKYQNNNVFTEFAIELKQEKKVIGSIMLMLKSKRAGGVIELGVTLNDKYQGNGYMTECVNNMFKFIKSNKLAKRIEAMCDVENIKAENVMKRCGMTFEGILRKAADDNLHERCDLALYSILDEEIKI